MRAIKKKLLLSVDRQ